MKSLATRPRRPKPVTEDYPKRPADLYGSIKVCCEEIGRYYHRETYGIEFIVLRYVSIYGPGKGSASRPAIFLRPAHRKSAGGQVTIPQGGDQLNDAVYVGDVARSVYLALKAERPDAWVFNIGTGKAWTPRDFLNAAARCFLIIRSSSARAKQVG